MSDNDKNDKFEYLKPSRTRVYKKPEREERVKDRVPKHHPYKRSNPTFIITDEELPYNDVSKYTEK